MAGTMNALSEASLPTEQAAPAAALLQLEFLRQSAGCVRGAHAPVAVACLAVRDSAHWAGLAERAAALLESDVPGSVVTLPLRRAGRPRGPGFEQEVLFVRRLLTQLGAMCVQIGLPALDAPQAMPLSPRPADGASRWLLTLSAYSPRAVSRALTWLVRWYEELSTSGEVHAWSSERRAELDGLLNGLNRLAPPGNNVRHFVRVAYERGIPWLVLPSGVIQYGWGRRARWLSSTFTDATPGVAARMARDKASANALLRQAGLPAPEHRRVKTVQAALEAARALGYPVVVKPANLDGGIGVSAGLQTEQMVRAAFENATRHSREILVEKHVEGRDYRITVAHGKALSTVERVPAGVTGDGEHSVSQLIELANRDPRRSTRRWGQMKPLQVGEEGRALLEEQGVALDTVLPAGQFARLRRSSNVSSGGTPVPVNDVIHPDNAALAVRATRVLRLDIAGIDLIIPDISRSWRESGGAICEVNGQPQLSLTSPHIYGQLFDELIEGQGRIATALVLSTGDVDEVVRECTRIMADRNLCVGISTPSGLFIGGECVRSGRRSSFADVRSLLLDPTVDAVVLVTDGKELLSTGLPFDRFDVLAIAEWRAAVEQEAASIDSLLASVLGLLKQHCSGAALIRREHPETALVVRQLGERRVERTSSQNRLALRLAQQLLQRHTSHGARRT